MSVCYKVWNVQRERTNQGLPTRPAMLSFLQLLITLIGWAIKSVYLTSEGSVARPFSWASGFPRELSRTSDLFLCVLRWVFSPKTQDGSLMGQIPHVGRMELPT